MPDERICAREGCENPVSRKQSNAIFCSPWCANKAANDRRYQRPESLTPEPPPPSDLLFGRREKADLFHVEDVQEGEFAIYWADSHIPFVDWPLMGAIGKVIHDFQPRREFEVGDIQDCYDLSRFDKNPTRLTDLTDEGRQTVTLIDHHKSLAPDMEQYFDPGNHGDRLQSWLCRNAGSLYGLKDVDTGEPILSIPSLLKLKERGVHYYPFTSRLDYQGFIITHGPKRGGGGKLCAKWMGDYIRSSGVCFHFHRNQSYSWIGDRGQPQTFYAVGPTCTLDPDYLPFPDWHQGFGYSRVINGKVHFQHVHVFDRRFTVEGKVYKY